MKKTVMIGMAAGVAATMMMLTGCSSKEHQLANVAGANGFLGSRGVVPPPFSSPKQLKDVPAAVPTAPAQDAQFAAPTLSEPALADEDNVLGTGGRVASIAPISGGTAAPANTSDSFVPAPNGNEINTTPMFQDLSTGKTTTVAQTPSGDVMTMPNGVQAGELTYTVKKGDTLTSIARMYSVDWKDIAIVNDMNKGNANIKVGQTLKLPSNAVLSISPATATAAATEPAPIGTVAALPAPTPAKATTQKPQAAKSTPKSTSTSKVAVKPLPADGKYIVTAGDSIWKIGHKYGISPESIRKTNNLTSDRLSIGQVLILRKDPAPAKTTASAGSADAASKATPTKPQPAQNTGLAADKHIVVSGDNIWTLARKYKIKEKDIWQWNNLKSSNLRIGQVLIVSKPANAPAAPAQNGIPNEVPAADDSQKSAVPPATQTASANAVPDAVVVLNNSPATNTQAQVSVEEHSVQPNEDLPAILRKHAITPEVFMKYNPSFKQDTELKPGDTYKVPVED